jgi:hypothetical protein
MVVAVAYATTLPWLAVVGYKAKDLVAAVGYQAVAGSV